MIEATRTEQSTDRIQADKFLCHIDVLLRYLTNERAACGIKVSMPDGWHQVTLDGKDGELLVANGVVVATAFADDLMSAGQLLRERAEASGAGAGVLWVHWRPSSAARVIRVHHRHRRVAGPVPA